MNDSYIVGIKEQFLISFIRLSIEERILLRQVILSGKRSYIQNVETACICKDDFFFELKVVSEELATTATLIQTSQKLLAKQIKITDSTGITIGHWFDSYSVSKEGEDDVICFKPSSLTLNFLKEVGEEELACILQQFSTKPLNQVEHMYTATLYKLIEERVGRISEDAVVMDFNLMELRQGLGIESGVYDCTQNLKKRVLNPAVNDLNKILGIRIGYRNITNRGSKAITGYRFTVSGFKPCTRAPK